ncbi:signal peptidase I [uncultured Roseovarius sp.]|uniref:signal peptidase I n=1 Tax=uncultured Roseovarius sp. TaxID=293344 RepID=UPI00262CD7E3|nr:signal peptidase I [uncultured Roseovarius sp.]
MPSVIRDFRNLYNSSGYLGKALTVFMKYCRTLIACLLLKKEIAVKNPKFLEPVTFFALSIVFVTAILKAYWPLSPLEYYAAEYENALVRLLFEILPLPISTIFILLCLIIAIPFVLIAFSFRFDVRIVRVFRVILYLNASGLVLVAVLYFGTLTGLGFFTQRFDNLYTYIYMFSLVIIGIYFVFALGYFLSVSCGLSAPQFLLVLLVSAIVQPLIVALAFGFDAAKKFNELSYSFPTPVTNIHVRNVAMEPTIPYGSLVLVDRLAMIEDFDIGDLIIYRTDYGSSIGRVFGTPRNNLALRDGLFFLDGDPVERQIVDEKNSYPEFEGVWDDDDNFLFNREHPISTKTYREKLPTGKSYQVFQSAGLLDVGDYEADAEDWETYVREDLIYTFSDNRQYTVDDEFGFGWVHRHDIIGKVFFVAFPAHIGPID